MLKMRKYITKRLIDGMCTSTASEDKCEFDDDIDCSECIRKYVGHINKLRDEQIDAIKWNR